jgi:pimeloyl-ACP methyl ester carboxylesterase
MQKSFKVLSSFLGGILFVHPIATTAAESTEPAPPPPGKMYDVGGHKMHLYRTGTGGPAVILEAGAGAFSVDWYLVQHEVEKFTTVCSYDRAGHAWSELGPRPRTMRQAVADLHRLLAEAAIPGPYILVGHSMGGLLVRIFASQYPNQVAGMVLVDSGFENSYANINGKMVRAWDSAKPRVIPAAREKINDDERVLTAPELEGYQQFLKWAGPPTIEEPFTKLPAPIQKLRLWAASLPQSMVTDYNPYGSEELILLFAERLRVEHPLGAEPSAVLTRKSQAHPPEPGLTQKEMEHVEEVRVEGQHDLKTLSSNGIFVESDYPVHEIHLTQPDLVAKAIQRVWESAKTGGSLKPVNTDKK